MPKTEAQIPRSIVQEPKPNQFLLIVFRHYQSSLSSVLLQLSVLAQVFLL